MVSLSEALATALATRNQFNHWLKTGVFGTAWAETTAGVARDLVRTNVLELSFIAAFVRAGINPKAAKLYSDALLRRVKSNHRIYEWIAFPDGKPKSLLPFDTLDENLAAKFPDDVVFHFIRTGEIVRRVDRLFAEQEPAD